MMSAPWIRVDHQLPDSDLTVLITTINCDEPVWLGYYDGAFWRTIEGNIVKVLAWQDIPDPELPAPVDYPHAMRTGSGMKIISKVPGGSLTTHRVR